MGRIGYFVGILWHWPPTLMWLSWRLLTDAWVWLWRYRRIKRGKATLSDWRAVYEAKGWEWNGRQRS